ncbi:MAG: hypothetical protein H6719_29070 [Sandaracinaceae bacterium]|nr:hypothetical protein [Sandaracinaceae bacterium]
MSETDAPRAHFGLFGFPVRIHPFFWVVSLLFGLSGLGETWSAEVGIRVAIWVSVLFVSILWHELGHAFAMRRYGYAPFIVLHGMGGATSWGKGPARPSATTRIVVSLAGPIFGFLLGGLVFGIQRVLGPGQHWAVKQLLEMMVAVNVFWGACNLVPMLPWDGGHALHGLLDLVTNGKGLKPTAIITIVTGVGLAALLYLFVPGFWWPIFLCGISVMLGVQTLRAPPGAKPKAVTRSADPMQAIVEVRAMLERSTPLALTQAVLFRAAAPEWKPEATRLFEQVAPKCGSPSQRAMALELAAWAYLLGGDPRSAQAAVTGMRPTHDPSPILAALVAARNDRPRDALAAAREMDEVEARRRIEGWAHVTLGAMDDALDAIADDRDAGAFIDSIVFTAGAFDAAAELGERLFERFGHAEDAYNAACSHARGGRASDGLAWLARAVDAGYDDVAHLEADDDLAAVRELEGYAPLRARLG